MKQLCFMIISLIIISLVKAEKLKTELKTDKKAPITISKTGRSSFRVNPFSLPKDADIYWQGWVKYFHYDNGTHFERPLAFFRNNEYYTQRIKRKNMLNGDLAGTIKIPSKFQFFLVLYNNSLNIYSSRSKIIKTVYDTLHIDYIGPVPEDKPLKGGIKDLGNFNEGKCIELTSKIPDTFDTNFNPQKYMGLPQTWIICTDKEKDKSSLLMMLLKLKVRRQRDSGEVMTKDAIEDRLKGQVDTLNAMIKSIKPRRALQISKPTDGYWMLLQDWTECSLKCGGGLRYQQWTCVPPKSGGKPCKGKSIKTRPCNTQKCPGVGTFLKLLNSTVPVINKPIIKVAPFSIRPQRYSLCQIKDNDAFMTTFNKDTREKAKIPVRIVMNNQTFTIFGDDSYSNVIYSFKLEYSHIMSMGSFCCFSIKDSHKDFKICGYQAYCGNKLTNNWVEQWKKDFLLFKVDCRVGREKALLSQEDEHNLDDDFNGKVGAAKEELIALNAELMEKKERKEEQRLMRGKVLASQNNGFTLLQKEINLENMIRKEEKEKEGLEIKNVIKILMDEKKKKKCLMKTLRQRQKQNQMLLEERDNENEVKSINNEISIEIELKRNQLKRQVALLRARARRKKAELEDQVNRVRGQMAKELLEANKNGNMKNCIKGKNDNIFRNNYCNTNFVDDYLKNNDCKVQETYCYLCCENEFGNAFLEKRDQCYNMCDGKSSLSLKRSKIVDRKKIPIGGWVWVSNKKR